MKVIFFGTPEFATHILDHIHHSEHTILAVVTAPDKPAGRGKKLRQSDVKKYAIAHQLKVLQPTNLKDDSFVQELQALKPDIQLIVAFRMLPKKVWNLPPFGTFNIHASLLPQYRGAAPINHAIIQGETTSGVTAFFLEEKIDTGNIIQQKETTIHPDDNAEVLHDKLMVLGASVALNVLNDIEKNGQVKTTQQHLLFEDEEALKKAPKIFKPDCFINWDKPAKDIHNLIRGLSPYPGTITTIHTNDAEEALYKIYKSDYEIIEQQNLTPGTIVTDNKTHLKVACKDGFIHILEIQKEGKKRLDIKTFFLGNSLSGKAIYPSTI